MKTLHELVEAQAERSPDAIAVGAPGRAPLTFAGLLAHVGAVGGALRDRGIGREDRVAIVLPNGPEMATSFVSVAAFATAAPLNPAYRDPEFDFFLEDLGPKALIVLEGVDSPCRAVAERRGVPIVELAVLDGAPAGLFELRGGRARPAAPAEIERAGRDDVALVLHTSGTTSRPKMVPLSHANLCANAANIARTLALGPDDRVLNVMPLYHIHGLMAATLASLTAGASVHCSPGFDAARFFEWYAEIAPTWYTAVPTIHQAVLVAAPAHAPLIAKHPLRFVRSSSAALAPPVMAELERVLGAPVLEAYGMTEASHQMCSNPLPPAARKPGSVGLPTMDLAIMDGAGNLLAAGARGEIVIRGPNVTRGYEANPAANASSFTDGWFRTGDEGFIDPEGYVHLSGRLKEIINKAGEKISPREIDEVLMQHPAVHQVVTFALPHPTLGEDVAAAVVAKPGAALDEAELRHFSAERLAEFKVPQRILVVAEVPKGPTGKLKRTGLAEHFAAELAVAAYLAPRDDVEERLARVWAAELKLDRVGVHDNYFVLGGDSLQAVMLAAAAARAGVPFAVDQLFRHPTIAELAPVLSAARAPEPSALGDTDLAALRVEAARAAGLAPAEIVDAYRLLPFQAFVAGRYEPRLSPGALVTTWTVDGALDPARLRQAFQALVDRYPILRTGFVKDADSGLVQFVLARAEIDFVEHDVRGADEAAAVRREAIVDDAHRRGFNLARPPLIRATLVRSSDDTHLLSVVWQHAVADLWSVGLIERALWASYDDLAAGRGEAVAADAGAPLGDFVRAALVTTSAAEQAAFWIDELGGLPDAALTRLMQGPGGFRLPSAVRHRAMRSIDPALLEEVGAWCRTRALTTSTLFHGAWALVLARHLGLDDIVIGSAVSGRWGSAARIETVVGPTMGVVPLRVRVAPSAPIVGWLLGLQARLAAVQRFAHTPWDRIAAAIHRRALPVGCTLAVENRPAALWERPSASVAVHDLQHRTHMPQPLMISVFPVPRPHLKATYDPSFVTDAEVAGCLDGMLGALVGLTRAGGDGPLLGAVDAALGAVPSRERLG